MIAELLAEKVKGTEEMDMNETREKCDKISVIVPCYNEEEVLPETARRLREKQLV